MTQIALPKRCIVRRINTRLRARNEHLYLTKSHAVAKRIGSWYVVDLGANCVTAQGCDLEAKARDLRALAPFERLA